MSDELVVFIHLHDSDQDKELQYYGSTLDQIRAEHQKHPKFTELYSGPVKKITFKLDPDEDLCYVLAMGALHFARRGFSMYGCCDVEDIDRKEVLP